MKQENQSVGQKPVREHNGKNEEPENEERSYRTPLVFQEKNDCEHIDEEGKRDIDPVQIEIWVCEVDLHGAVY